MALTFVRGLDGSGKSTAARAAAFALSAAHPRAKIAVTDSTGRYLFCGGKVVSHRVQHLYKLKPGHDGSALKTGMEILAYGLSRRLINSPGHFGVGDAELLISVRDPHRIDPAAYAKIYGWQWLSAMSPQRRLRTLDAVTVSPYADVIVMLNATVDQVTAALMRRGERLSRHETRESLMIVGDELPRVVAAYQRMYGSSVEEVEALATTTSEAVLAAVGPLLEQ